MAISGQRSRWMATRCWLPRRLTLTHRRWLEESTGINFRAISGLFGTSWLDRTPRDPTTLVERLPSMANRCWLEASTSIRPADAVLELHTHFRLSQQTATA